jgi:hypothetical protein
MTNSTGSWQVDRRPWGWMVKLIDFWKMGLWLKLIRVSSGHRTSLQYHRMRSELHIGSHGLHYVPRNQWHRLESGIYLEIAWGVCREGDIVRIQDDYGRT